MFILQILVNGVVLGCLYACIAAGFSLVWLVTRNPGCAGAGVAAITLSQVVLVGAISWLKIPMDM